MIHIDIDHAQNPDGNSKPVKIAINLDTELRPVFIDLIKAITERIRR